jgi:hypothetical protein
VLSLPHTSSLSVAEMTSYQAAHPKGIVIMRLVLIVIDRSSSQLDSSQMPHLWKIGRNFVPMIFLYALPFPCFLVFDMAAFLFQVYFAEKVTALDKDWHKMCFKVTRLRSCLISVSPL